MPNSKFTCEARLALSGSLVRSQPRSILLAHESLDLNAHLLLSLDPLRSLCGKPQVLVPHHLVRDLIEESAERVLAFLRKTHAQAVELGQRAGDGCQHIVGVRHTPLLSVSSYFASFLASSSRIDVCGYLVQVVEELEDGRGQKCCLVRFCASRLQALCERSELLDSVGLRFSADLPLGCLRVDADHHALSALTAHPFFLLFHEIDERGPGPAFNDGDFVLPEESCKMRAVANSHSFRLCAEHAREASSCASFESLLRGFHALELHDGSKWLPCSRKVCFLVVIEARIATQFSVNGAALYGSHDTIVVRC
mmetsp:Transcript_62845/g.148070  ORF Transcript_62845/g.148070 Transcript_62845/m.148070 type:complete len:310 (+) Transcript_62845:61-990(+)